MSDFQTVFTIVRRMIPKIHQKKNISKKKEFPGRPGGFLWSLPVDRKQHLFLVLPNDEFLLPLPERKHIYFTLCPVITCR